MPYSYLFTSIKSPITKVGIIDPDGILYGSTINDLKINTKNKIGKNDAKKSIATGTSE